MPTGRLTQLALGEPFIYTTLSGWTVHIAKDWGAITITHPNGTFNYQVWGIPSGDSVLVLTHENLRGKHIKDRFGIQRTHLLPGGAIITLTGGGKPLVGILSIYDGNESHRLDLKTHAVTRSCAIGYFGEADEHDGETSRFVDTEDGLLFEHVYDQAVSSTGVPLEKVENIYPLGRLFTAEPNHVIDYFDDPRLGHT